MYPVVFSFPSFPSTVILFIVLISLWFSWDTWRARATNSAVGATNTTKSSSLGSDGRIIVRYSFYIYTDGTPYVVSLHWLVSIFDGYIHDERCCVPNPYLPTMCGETPQLMSDDFALFSHLKVVCWSLLQDCVEAFWDIHIVGNSKRHYEVVQM